MDIYVWICENEIEIAERETHKNQLNKQQKCTYLTIL